MIHRATPLLAFAVSSFRRNNVSAFRETEGILGAIVDPERSTDDEKTVIRISNETPHCPTLDHCGLSRSR